MTMWIRVAIIAAAGMFFPLFSQAQGLASDINSLHSVLEQLYDTMMPRCSKLIGVAQGIAGFAATWYIAVRVWRHIANAEPIDFYPLFRPFVLGFCVMIFPSVLSLINDVMKPTVTATAAMVEDSDKAIKVLLAKKEEAIKKTDAWQMYVGETGNGDRDKWYRYTHDDASPSDEGMFESVGNDIKFALSKAAYNFSNSVKEWMSEILQVLFQAASLCVDTLRTFQLIVLAILGPLVFGIAVFDGFQHTLSAWIARYINIFLWLPVANIFGSIIGQIQEKMIELDISQVNQTGDTFFSSTDIAYLVFLIIGIIGYFTVPSVANYIIQAGGGGALAQKATGMFNAGGGIAKSGAIATGGRALETVGNIARIPQYINEGYHSKDKDGNSGYMADKLSGNKGGSKS